MDIPLWNTTLPNKIRTESVELTWLQRMRIIWVRIELNLHVQKLSNVFIFKSVS